MAESAYDADLEAGLSKYIEFQYETRKQGIIDLAQDRYGRNWKSELATRLSGASRGSKEYSNQMRNFQGERLYRDAGGKKWEELGKSLGPINTKVTTNSVTIVVKGTQERGGYRGGTRQRTYQITLTGVELYQFVTSGDMTLSRLGADYYGFDFTEDSGDDTSSGETEVTSVQVL